MLKKELIRQNKALTEKILEANSIIRALENSLKQSEDEIRILKEKLAAKNAEVIKEPEIEDNEPEICETAEEITEENIEEIVEVEELTENDEFVEEAESTEPVVEHSYHEFDFVEEAAIDNDDDLKEYAVKVIGKIVSESVKINCVLASSNNENKKELINLVLGRTEVAKEEIFSVLSTNLNADLLRNSIDKECAATLEYYHSILGQL